MMEAVDAMLLSLKYGGVVGVSMVLLEKMGSAIKTVGACVRTATFLPKRVSSAPIIVR